MRFFKYLIFLFLFISFESYASWNVDSIPSTTSSTKSGACDKVKSNPDAVYNNMYYPIQVQYYDASCFVKYSLSFSDNTIVYTAWLPYKQVADPECWHPDYKIVSQPVTSQLKKSICVPINGAMCKYTGDLTNAPIVNGSITTTFESVSKTPDPNCTEDLQKPICDPKDPYGGCFTPPDDGCTRQFNGSIECPPDVAPPVEKGCNGATYCKRPPQGCGEGYVSGTWNGERICIKTSPSTGSGDGSGTGTGDGSGDGSGTGGSGTGTGDGSGTGSNTSTGTGSSTSTNTTTNPDGSTSTSTTVTNNSFTVDFSPVVKSVDKVSEKITNLKNELLTSINDLANQLGLTNSKLDQINANGVSQNSKQDQTNDLLQQIKDKIPASTEGSSPSDQPASSASVDLSTTNDLLGQIKDGINDIKNVFSDEGKAELQQIGQPSNDSRFTAAQANAQSSLNALANKLTFGSSSCLSDFQIQLPIFGPVNIALSQWCSLLALVKILFQLVVLLTCLRMLDATVRTI